MRTALSALLSGLSLVLAGCIATDDTLDPASTGADGTQAVVPEAPGFDFATIVDPDHVGHQLHVLHEASHGLGLVGHTEVQSMLPPGTRGSITQIDVQGSYAVVSGMEGNLAFIILDISDPAAPTVLSAVPSAADGWTARFSDDGAYVFYGCQILGALTALGGGTVKGDCEDPMSVHAGTAPMGVVAYDVTDKADPTFVAFVPTDGAHNLQVASIGGVDHVFTNAVDIVRFDRAAGTLEVVANVPGVHDATVAKHPVTGDWLLYTGTEQLAIYNVNDPTHPEPVFEGGIEGVEGWHEQTPVPGLVDGRALLVLAGETFASAQGGVADAVGIVDVTDPTKPVHLSTWEPPFAPMMPWASYLYSVHEIAATPTGQVAIAWYHGGVWVIDVSTKERQEAPVTLAAYQPSMPISVVPATFFQTAVPVVPFVWGAGWDARGYLVVPDMQTGVYVLEPAWGLHPATDGGQ